MHEKTAFVYSKKKALLTLDIRPELELLICCARLSLGPQISERIGAIVQKDIDWTYLVSMADRHRLLPLLYRNLYDTYPEAVPEATLNLLQNHCRNNTYRNLFLAKELLKLLDMFESNGIRAIPYKGIALAASVYGSLALREFYDLDILVLRRDVLRAKELLIRQGYQQPFNLTNKQELVYLYDRCEHPLWRSSDGLLVEIQWNIVPRHFSFPLDLEPLWKRLEPISLGGKQVLTLSPEDLLLILCVHGAKHMWERISWICDIAEMIRVHKELDWEMVIARARGLGSERMLFLGLFLANSILEADIPGEILRRVKADARVKALAIQVSKRLFRETDDWPGVFESSLFHMRARENWRDRIRYCFRLAMTPTVGDWELMTLPPSLPFLYYPLRAVRLVRKYGRGLLRLLL